MVAEPEAEGAWVTVELASVVIAMLLEGAEPNGIEETEGTTLVVGFGTGWEEAL